MTYTEDEVRQMVRDGVAAHGLVGFARRIGVNPGTIHHAVNTTASLGPQLLAALGLRKVVTYEKGACNPQSGSA